MKKGSVFKEVDQLTAKENTMGIVTKTYGGNAGGEFNIQAVKSLGLIHGKWIDALLLNDKRYGGTGGGTTPTRTLDSDEYIHQVKIQGGKYVDGIEFTTNKGNKISGGHFRSPVLIKNIRVIGLGGKSGRFLDQIKIKYIENYKPSTLKEENQEVVIQIIPPGKRIETSEREETMKLTVSELMMELMFSQENDSTVSAFGDFMAKLSLETEYQFTTRSELRNEIKKLKESETKTYYEPPSLTYAGLEIISVDIYSDENGFTWFMPKGKPNIVTVPIETGLSQNIKIYDLTGVLGAQIPSLANQKETKYGYDYYNTVVPQTSVQHLIGNYENHLYDKDGKNDWHYVTISKIDESTLRWKNRAGISWTLKIIEDKEILKVGDDCPYFSEGHTTVKVVWNKDGDKVLKLLGPFDEPYDKLS